jgi:preprotein translocase subunit SecE
MNIFAKIGTFLKEVRQELKKVTWPTRQETVKYTIIVVAVSLAVAAFLGSVDFGLTWAINKFIIK